LPSQIVFALDNKEILQQTYDFLLSHMGFLENKGFIYYPKDIEILC